MMPLPVQGIPEKGKLLTEISAFWFNRLRPVIGNHVLSTDVETMPAEVQAHTEVLRGRTMLVKKARVIPLEAIVRGYITGLS
jgi:phosphoribosylaminoimidazole-succinocarboxamide synthase